MCTGTDCHICHVSQSSIFGAAKPREAVLASREGKREEDILKEDVKRERVHVRRPNVFSLQNTFWNVAIRAYVGKL